MKMQSMEWSQINILLTVWFGVYCNYAVYSVIAPSFPKVARSKGIAPEKFALVFAIYSVAQITASFLAGRYLNRIGARPVVCIGLAVTGVATVLFGFIESIEDASLFVLISLSIRFIEGAGFAAFFTSALTVVVDAFPSDPGYYVGLTESIVTLGMIMGPPIGSYLFVRGGFPLPLFTFGGALVAASLIAFFVIPPPPVRGQDEKRKQSQLIDPKDYIQVLQLSQVMASVACTFLNVATDVFILINLDPHCSSLSISTIQMGFVYLCLFLSYGVSSPASGKLADRTDRELLIQALGCLCVAFSFLIFAPIVLPIDKTVVAIVVSLLIKGIGAGPLISCSYSSILKAALAAGREDNSKTYTLVSSIVSFSIPLGNLIGGLAAPIMYDKLGMEVSCFFNFTLFTSLAYFCLTQDKKLQRLRQSCRANYRGVKYQQLSEHVVE